MFSTETALSDGELVVPISFARQLERENAAMRALADHAETLLCNSLPMAHCSQSDWDEVIRRWRDQKHGEQADYVAKQLNEFPFQGGEVINTLGVRRNAMDAALVHLFSHTSNEVAKDLNNKVLAFVCQLERDLKTTKDELAAFKKNNLELIAAHNSAVAERENAAMAEENSRLRIELDAHHNSEQLRVLRAENADLIKRLEAHDGWDDYNAIKALRAEKAALRKDKDRLDWLDCRTVSRLDWVLTNVEMHKLPIRDAIDVSMKEVEP